MLTEYVGRKVDLDVKEAMWDMQVYAFGANMLAGPTGPSILPEGNSAAASVLGGAFGGAATGAMAGSFLGGPGLGTAIGAGLGGLIAGLT